MNELKIIPRVISGDDLHGRIKKKMKGFNEMKIEKGVEVPNLVNWTFGFIIFFGMMVGVKSFKKEKKVKEEEEQDFKPRHDLAIGVIFMTLVYSVIISLHLIDFRIATGLYVLIAGGYLTKFDKKQMIYTLEIALLMSLGLYFVFTEIFLIELP